MTQTHPPPEKNIAMKRSQLAMLATTLLSLPGSLSAQSFVNWYGNTNNAAGYGVTVTGSYSPGTWQDAMVANGIPATNFGSQVTMQANWNNSIGNNRQAILMSFGSLGLTVGDTITSAQLHTSFVSGGAATNQDTWHVFGLNTPLDEGTATWNTMGAALDAAWAGGVLIGNPNYYGTFSTVGLPANDGDQFSINVTSALQAYQSGTISTLALINFTNVPVGPGSSERLAFHSSEASTTGYQPGLAVTVSPVPEPGSALLLGAASTFALLRRRRAAASRPASSCG
ncbi:MAG: hypothetical protein RIS79_225 [Verrucomicrobiota bacterium]|jgi:hypothetical protein